jgi:predicted Rossmann-fold nucleotide-binding protein
VRVQRIVSGGQTGVDRAGLDAAMEAGIPAGGWCPEGRLAEDGRIPGRYPVTELESSEYGARTERNVVDSDATLVLNIGQLSEGTLLTVQLARRHGKPVLVVQLENDPDPSTVSSWIGTHEVRVLNVAGPRESKRPGVYEMALKFIRELLAE